MKRIDFDDEPSSPSPDGWTYTDTCNASGTSDDTANERRTAFQGRLLRLAPRDNVAVATADLAAGMTVAVEAASVTLLDNIPLGYKVALASIAAGEKIHKYGCPIGSATCAIRIGQLVHSHNLKSDYLPTFVLESDAIAKEPPA